LIYIDIQASFSLCDTCENLLVKLDCLNI
jgi:hypothetical protein